MVGLTGRWHAERPGIGPSGRCEATMADDLYRIACIRDRDAGVARQGRIDAWRPFALRAMALRTLVGVQGSVPLAVACEDMPVRSRSTRSCCCRTRGTSGSGARSGANQSRSGSAPPARLASHPQLA
jgi:hypothetical protein